MAEEKNQGPAVDKRVISRKQQRVVNDRNINSQVVRSLMVQENGRRWIWNLLNECNVFSQTVHFGEGGHAMTAFAEGKRSLGLRILDDIVKLTPNEYLKMTVENKTVEADLESPDAGPDTSAE